MKSSVKTDMWVKKWGDRGCRTFHSFREMTNAPDALFARYSIKHTCTPRRTTKSYYVEGGRIVT